MLALWLPWLILNRVALDYVGLERSAGTTMLYRCQPFESLAREAPYMPIKSKDLHGNAPDQASTALLLIDVINDFEFEGGDALLKLALPMSRKIAEFKRLATEAGIPAIYVNDNFGKWQSDFKKIVAHCLEDDVRGKAFVERILPDDRDYFVLKPKHSGFFCTDLDLLLKHLGVSNLILTGIAVTTACSLPRTMLTCGTSIYLCPRIALSRRSNRRMTMH